MSTTAAGSGDRSSRSDRAPHVANLRIEMIGGGGLGRADQKHLHARFDHDPRFFVRIHTPPSIGFSIVPPLSAQSLNAPRLYTCSYPMSLSTLPPRADRPPDAQ